MDACTMCYSLFTPFINKNNLPNKRCLPCLEKTRKTEARRPERNRDWRLDNRDPVRRQQWKEIHADKTGTYYINHREKKKREMGIEVYRNKQAINAASWRARNPEHVAKQKIRNKKSAQCRLSSVKRQAYLKNNEWQLTDDYSLKIIERNCFYCTGKVENVSNGIPLIALIN